MTVEEMNKIAVRRIYSECWSGDMQAIDEIFAPDMEHDQFLPGWPTGREGFKALVHLWRTAFPDIHEEAVEIIAEGDRAVCRFRLSGTHLGQFYQLPPTGRRIEIMGADFYRFASGMVTEYSYHEDTLGLFYQLGLLPLPKQDIAGVAKGSE